MKKLIETNAKNAHVTILEHAPPPLEPIAAGIPELRGLKSMTMIEADSATGELNCTVLSKHFEEMQEVRSFHLRQPKAHYRVVPPDPSIPKADAELKIRLQRVNPKSNIEKKIEKHK